MTSQGFRQFIIASAAAAALLTTSNLASASLVGADGQPVTTQVSASQKKTAQAEPAVYRDREKVAEQTPAAAPETAAPAKDPEAKTSKVKPDAGDGDHRRAQRRHHRRDFGRWFFHRLHHFRIGLRW
jgi:hypothetical protein